MEKTLLMDAFDFYLNGLSKQKLLLKEPLDAQFFEYKQEHQQTNITLFKIKDFKAYLSFCVQNGEVVGCPTSSNYIENYKPAKLRIKTKKDQRKTKLSKDKILESREVIQTTMGRYSKNSISQRSVLIKGYNSRVIWMLKISVRTPKERPDRCHVLFIAFLLLRIQTALNSRPASESVVVKQETSFKGRTPKKSVCHLYKDLKVLKSYKVNEDSTCKFYKVILVDSSCKTIRRDPRINWIYNTVQ
ncbi:hypothetical protein BB558_007378 [Smittium angustum]|uniref:Ribosomal protein L15 n=1 Tax=Smittium angustum TaxID=133377 RepID=A0A2U1IV73_SMIAN|nr:hypothetical protein BB558_007378 [Smittium angustum]